CAWHHHTALIYLFISYNHTPTTSIHTLSLHDALPISSTRCSRRSATCSTTPSKTGGAATSPSCTSATSRPTPPLLKPPESSGPRSEEHTSELQSRENLGCRLLLEKKKKKRDSKDTYNR